MKIKDLDRVVIMVKDMDEAVGFFKEKLGIEFIEHMGPPDSSELGMRVSMNLDHRMELVEPIFPISEAAPLYIKRGADLLKERDNVIIALSFKVDVLNKVTDELEEKKIRIANRYDVEAFDAWSMYNLHEVITDEDDTLGIPLVFAEYDRG